MVHHKRLPACEQIHSHLGAHRAGVRICSGWHEDVSDRALAHTPGDGPHRAYDCQKSVGMIIPRSRVDLADDLSSSPVYQGGLRLSNCSSVNLNDRSRRAYGYK